MTLYKKLVVGMVTVFILLMASVFVIQFNTTRDSLEQQQRSEVNNTINTVGLALAPYLKDKDKVAVESVINALFDGSTYSVVRLTALDSDYQIVRSYPVKPSSVPQWFIDLNLFKAIHDKRVVTSGWMQLAEVEIISTQRSLRAIVARLYSPTIGIWRYLPSGSSRDFLHPTSLTQTSSGHREENARDCQQPVW